MRQSFRITLSVIAILIIGNILFAKQDKVVDGNIWNRMKKDNKLYYVTGYLNGLEKAEKIIDINVGTQQKNEFAFIEPFYVSQMRKKIRDYIPQEDNRIYLIIELLNAFYADSHNLKIPFEAALRITLVRHLGDVEKSDFWLNEARRRAGNKN